MPIVYTACSQPSNEVSMEVGVQIYSVRDPLMQDFEGTINAIGEMGFDYIEAYGLAADGLFFGEMTPNEVYQIVNNAGMRIASTHCNYFDAEQAPAVLEAAKALQTDYVIIPYLTEEARADYFVHAENFNSIGNVFKGSGIKFAYHNHDFEFFEMEDGSIPMEILIENTDPELVSFQADLYWIAKVEMDPLAFIQKYTGRFCSYHVKDANENLDQTTVGSGIIDFKSILAQNEEQGIDYIFIEDERTDDPLGNIKAGLDYIKAL